MNQQSRSYSEHSVLEGSIVDERLSLRNANLALPEEKSNLKRACSFPSAAHHPSVKLAATLASTKPSFKIQIPSIDLSNLSTAFYRHQRYRKTGVACPPKAAHGDHVLDSPIIVDHAIRTNLPPLFTPPEERPAITFTMSTLNSELVHQPHPSPTPEAQEITDSKWASERAKVGMEPGDGQGQSTASVTAEPSGGCEGVSDQGARGDSENEGSSPHWLDATMEATVSELEEVPENPQLVIKVVAQTLPSIAAEGASDTPTTAFPSLISALQTRLCSATPYFQVHHIVPLTFSLTSLPTSPANTPNVNVSVIPQTDYFSPNIFSSAVAVIDRHDKYSKPMMPSSPFAVVPNTADFVLYERYIPPSTVQEFKDLFLTTGQSALVDRLAEVSPKNGTLVFIYPTKTGAATFKTKLLDPILDPVLRSVITSHCLSSDIGVNIGAMAAVPHLLTFEAMQRKVQALLRGLGRDSRRFTLVHAKRAVVHVERKVWADWYVKQETPRIRNVTTEYINRAVRLPQEEHVSYAALTREIVEGVLERDYAKGEEPGVDGGIEVGAFVVRRGV